MEGTKWNSDELNIRLEYVQLSKVPAAEKLDEAQLQLSSLWKTSTGIMPTNPLALRVSLGGHWHYCRLRVKTNAPLRFRGMEDVSFSVRIVKSTGQPLVLPVWASHIAVICAGRAEVPLSLERYTCALDDVLVKAAQVDKGTDPQHALMELEADCVRVFFSDTIEQPA